MKLDLIALIEQINRTFLIQIYIPNMKNLRKITFRTGEGKRYRCSQSPFKTSQIQTLLSVDALKSLQPVLDQLNKKTDKIT